MARTVSLSQLRTDVSVQCDFVVGASGRYTPTILNRYINQSVQRFRERISNEGMTHYLTSTSGTITSGATSPYSFKTLDLSGASPAIVRVYGVDLTVSGVVKTLAHRPFQERNDYGAPTATGEPMAWAMYQTTSVAIMPAPNQSYSYTVWYLPLLADMSADGDTFDGVAGWEQWIVWDVVCQLIARDTYQAAYNQAVQLRTEIWQDIIRSSTKVTSAGGAIVGRDTLRAARFGRREYCGPVAAGGSGLPPDGSVTNAMLASAPEATIKGRARGAGAGSPTDLVPGQVAAITSVYSGFAAGLVPTGNNSTTLFLREDGTWAAPSVGGSVSGLALSQIQDLSPNRVLGRFGVSTGAAQQLTGQQVASMIGVFTGSAHGLVPFPSGGAAGLFLKDDATWATPAGGGGGSTGASPSAMFFFPPLSVLGNSAVASGVSEFLNRGQVASLLPLFGTASGATRGLVYSPTAGVANRFLRDDGTFQGVPSFTPTGIDFTQLLPMPEAILGRLGASGVPTFLSGSAVGTMLPVFNNVDKGLVPPASAGDATKFLRADQTWAVPPGGGGGGSNNPGGPTGSFQYNLGSGVFGGASGFSISASGINLLHDLTMPTGVVRFGSSGVAQSALLRIPYGQNLAAGRLDDDSNDANLIGWGAAAYRRLQFGQAPGGVDRIDEIRTEANRTTVGAGNVLRQLTDANHQSLSAGMRLGLQQLTHSASTDKLGGWTASGFANVATGITIGASGYQLGVGSGGSILHASGIDMRVGDIANVRRINQLDGIKVYGFVSGGGAASGSQEIVSASGTAFIVPETVTAGQIYALIPTLAVHGDTILLENRTGISHMINNSGTGMGVSSGFIATLAPSMGISARFASGAWEYGNRYKLGSF